MVKPLEGIRVIDFTLGQHGPAGTAMLGDMGAEVIHIEPPEGDFTRGFLKISGLPASLSGGRNFYFETNNRNKKSVTLDLKKEKAREIVYRLVEKSDIFVTNFLRPAVARLGLDYESLSQRNPKLIYAVASAWGPSGPDADIPGLDYAAQGRSGFMFTVGESHAPPSLATAGLADQTGAIILAYGIMTALVARERFGIGQMVNTSLLGSMMHLEALNVSSQLLLGSVLPRQDRATVNNPLWNHYECGDGKWIAIAMLQADRYWPYLVKAMGLQELEKDPRFENYEKRTENSRELVSIFDRTFATKSRDEWVEILSKSEGHLICGPIKTIDESVQDVQVLANDYVVEFDHPVWGRIKAPGFPVRLSKTPASIDRSAPELGEHTEMILTETLAYTWDEVSEFKAQGVIA